MASSSDFRQMGEGLSGELVDQLCLEHDREVQALYQEQLELRMELQRIVELMSNEIIPRERKMHEMLEQMQAAYESATKNMHIMMTEKLQGFTLSNDERQAAKKEMEDPLAAMEGEIAR